MILRVGFPARRSCLKTSILPNQQHNHIQARTHQADRRPWATIRKKHARENREQARSTIPCRRSELFSGVAKLSCYTKTGSLPSQKKNVFRGRPTPYRVQTTLLLPGSGTPQPHAHAAFTKAKDIGHSAQVRSASTEQRTRETENKIDFTK